MQVLTEKKKVANIFRVFWEVEPLVLCSGAIAKVGGKLGKGGVWQELYECGCLP